MAVYNAAYIVPLAVIITLFVFTMGRYRMTEAHGKILKGLSGALMLALGLLMLLRPEATNTPGYSVRSKSKKETKNEEPG